MAHGGHGGNSGKLAPPTGPISALLMVLSFCGFIWLCFKHPRVAARCFGAAFLLAVLFHSHDGSGAAHNPVAFLIVLWIGCEVTDRLGRDDDDAPAPPRRPMPYPRTTDPKGK